MPLKIVNPASAASAAGLGNASSRGADGAEFYHKPNSLQAPRCDLKFRRRRVRPRPAQGGTVREGRRRTQAVPLDRRRSNPRAAPSTERTQAQGSRARAARYTLAARTLLGFMGARRWAVRRHSVWGRVMSQDLPQVEIWTDGFCWPNPGGAAGLGVILRCNGATRELSEGIAPAPA
jgi:hypothetical protein